jgi:tetratricopeptide (TPR) repeat protein
MRKLSVVLAILLLVCGLRAGERPAEARQAQAGEPLPGRPVSAKVAQGLEDGLTKNADDLNAREQLIIYYFHEMLTSRTPEIEAKWEQDVLWLIEHHPEAELAGSPEAEIMPMGPIGSTEAYQRGKQLWLEQVEKHPDSQRILRNAGQYLSLFDAKVALGLLEKAAALDPGDKETSSRLAQAFEQQRTFASSSEEKAALGQKAFSIRERGLERAEGEERFYELADAATSAFEAGDTAKAQQYASELLQSAPKFKDNWNYGNAVHKGNIILGRLALRQGDIVSAKERLLAAGETPGSPQLNSFGPNMMLAKELLEKGEREVVLTYLQSCAKFWKMGDEQLQSWTATVKGGGMPAFGGNLLY